MKDRTITITCSEYNERLDRMTAEEFCITYEFYDNVVPPEKIIKDLIDKMREKLNALQL